MKPVRPMSQRIGGVGGDLYVGLVVRYKFSFPFVMKDNATLYSLLKQYVKLDTAWGVQKSQDPVEAVVIYVAWHGKDCAEDRKLSLQQQLQRAADAVEKALGDWAMIESIVKGVANAGDSNIDGGA